MAYYDCTSRRGVPKKRWATRAAAELVARIDARRDGQGRDIYKCPECEGWHTFTVREPEPHDTMHS